MAIKLYIKHRNINKQIYFLNKRKRNIKYKGDLKMGHKVWLFGSKDLGAVPDCIVTHLENMIKETNGDIEFIVGDSQGIETAFHKTLSSIGARSKTSVYCIDAPRHNVYDLNTLVLTPKYREDTEEVELYNGDVMVGEVFNMKKLEDVYMSPKLYELKDKVMSEHCTFALCYWDGKSRGTVRNIDRLKTQDKYVYVYTAQLG